MFDADYNADQRRGSQRGSFIIAAPRCCSIQWALDPRSDQRAGSATRSAFKGFTLVEVIVAAGIFFSLLIIVIGIFTRFTVVQRKGVGEQLLQEDIRFALELFEREVRNGWGSTYTVGSPPDQLFFRNQNGQCVSYRLHDEALERAQQDWIDDPDGDCDFTGGGSMPSWERVTSNGLKITRLRFIPEKAEAPSGQLQNQGFVALIMTFESAQSNLVPPIHLQSTVTSRNMIPYAREIYE